jgi:multiple sugar transport system substrate-binding protein
MILYNLFKRFHEFLGEIKSFRVIALIMLCFLISISIISCNNASQKVQLSFFVQKGQGDNWVPVVEEFGRRNPNISVVVKDINISHTDELREEYRKSCDQKRPSYDLVAMDIIWLADLVNDKCLMKIDESKFPDLKNEFLPKEVEAGKIDKILYRIPFSTDAGVLFYRKDLLKENNFSDIKTFDELIEASQKIQNKRQDVKYGYLWQSDHYEGLSAMFVEVLQGFGGFWIKKDKNIYKIGLKDDEAVSAVKFLIEVIDKKVSPNLSTPYDETLAREKFQNGEAIFMRNWPSTWAALSRSNSIVRNKIGIRPMVHSEGKDSKSGSTIGGWGFGIAERSIHKEEAIEAIKFFTSTEIQKQFALNAGYLPTRESLFYDPEIISKYSYFPELIDIINKYGVNRPQIPHYTEASSILQDCLSQALRRKKTAREAMEIAYKDTQDLLNKKIIKKSHSCDWT